MHCSYESKKSRDTETLIFLPFREMLLLPILKKTISQWRDITFLPFYMDFVTLLEDHRGVF